MTIGYTATSILITDDGDPSRPPLVLLLDATSEEIAAAHASYSTLIPEPDYAGFYDDLLISSIYKALIYMPKTADLAVALIVFVSQIHRAMAGCVNQDAMQVAIWNLLSQVALTEANGIELAGLMGKHHLTGTYLLAPPR